MGTKVKKIKSSKRKSGSDNTESLSRPKKISRKVEGKKKTDDEVEELPPTPSNEVNKVSRPKTKKHFIVLKSYDSKIEAISEKYNIAIDLVETNISNIVKLVEENPKVEKLFAERFPIFLQLVVWKIPSCHPKLLRINLEHSVIDAEDDVCLIVPDVKGIKNKLYEQHHDYYEEILKQKEITGIKKIMTFNELKSEYDSFELKRGLVELYDAFLVDGRISGRVVHQLGKIFYKKRKIPTPIKMNHKVKREIDGALKKSTFQVHSRSDCFSLQIGNSQMSERELVENIFMAIKNLDEVFPGGVNNLRTISIFAGRGSSLPIYVSSANPNEVKVPKVRRKKPKAYETVEGELTTKLNYKVKVKPTGDVTLKKISSEEN